MPRLVRRNSFTPRKSSRLATCRHTALCVTACSAAARVKLWCRAADSNAVSAAVEGIFLRTMDEAFRGERRHGVPKTQNLVRKLRLRRVVNRSYIDLRFMC